MSCHLLAITCEVPDPIGVAEFWGALLGRQVLPEAGGALVPGEGPQVGLRFVPGPSTTSGSDLWHLHLTTESPADRERLLAAAAGLGAKHVDVGQLPDEDHVVLADPAGAAFCVIEPGNRYLAGCGRLGEVACDGTREVGLFWRDALGWTLVWDQDGQTAIQSPLGGTKIGFGGPPVEPRPGRDRQRFDLAATDLPAELTRLRELGATYLGERGGGTGLADPDGNEFRLAPG